MSTVKFPSVQFDCDGMGLQFSRQCLTGYIHHYWVIARSSGVLSRRKKKKPRDWMRETGLRGGRERGGEKRKIERYGLKTIRGDSLR